MLPQHTVLRKALELSLFDPDSACNLVILPEQIRPIDNNDTIDDTQKSFLPMDLFPDNARVSLLPYGEAFYDSLDDLIPSQQAVNAFVLPPFLSGRHLSKRLKEISIYRDLCEIVTEHVLEIAAVGSRFWFILPMQILALRSCASFRQYLVDNVNIQLIFYCNDKHFDVAIVNFVGLLIEKLPATAPCTRFFQCPDIDDEATFSKVQNDLSRILKQTGGETEYGYILREKPQSEKPWLYNTFHPKVTRNRADLASLGGLRLLGDIATVRCGKYSKRFDENAASNCNEGGALVITGRDIRLDGSIECDDPRFCSSYSPEDMLKLGDICIRLVQSERHGRLICAVVDKGLGNAVANHTVLVIRPSSTLDAQERLLLADYLRSSKYWEIMNDEGAYSVLGPAVRLTPSHLCSIEVPVLDETMKPSVEALNTAARQFRQWANELENARMRMFEGSSMRLARTEILAAGRIAKNRYEAALLIGDFRHRVRTRFPHPIAFRWRTVEYSHPNLEGYLAVLECAEVTVTYLAMLALVLARSAGVQIKSLKTMAARISSTGHGTNFGDWLSILQEVSGRGFRKALSDDCSFVEVIQFWSDTEIQKKIQIIKDKRDDQSHGRGPKKHEVQDKFEETKGDLEGVLKRVEYLSDYPLLFVEQTHRDSILGLTKYCFRELMGDHQLVPISEASTTDPEIEAGSLYLLDRNRKLHLLRPLLIGRECPICQSWGTFFLDTSLRDGGEIIMKSMEHGHTFSETDASLADAFRYLGLIL